MKNKKNILDLSKKNKNKRSIFNFKNKKNFSSHPNLSLRVKVKKVKTKRKSNLDLKSKASSKSWLVKKKKIASIRSRDYNAVGLSDEIDDIWTKNKNLVNDKFKPRPQHKKKILPFIIFFLFLLAGTSIAGWYFFGTKELNGQGIDLTIKAPSKIISGENVELLIKYQNKESVKLKKMELRINYPKGFHFISSTPYASTLSSNVWELEDLKPGESGQVKILGQVIGNLDEEIVLEPSLYYEPANFSSFFESKALKKIKIDKLLMDFKVEAPAKIGNNTRVTYNIVYKNISDFVLDNFRLKMDYPDNFSIVETGGDAELLTENIWQLDEIRPGEENKINVTGFFDLDNMSSSTISAILEIKSTNSEIPLLGESDSVNWYPYLIIKKDILKSDLAASLKLSINSNNRDSAINWGDELEYSIHYKNLSDFDLKNVSLKVILNSEYLDWDSLDDNFNGLVDEGNKSITWNKKLIPSLAKLDIGQEGMVNFKIKILDFQNFEDDNLEEKVSNYSISSEAFLISDSLGLEQDNNSKETQEEISINSNVVVNKINSFVDFQTLARYYDESGEAVGSGPLPPVVGETTSYQIIWSLKSLSADLKNIIVKTTLPPGVEWGQGVVAEEQNLIFNDATRQVVWKVDDLEKNKKILAKFNVLITPDQSQLSKVVTLNNTITFRAEDTYSQGKINLNNPYLTTKLEGDKKALGKEKVIDLDL